MTDVRNGLATPAPVVMSAVRNAHSPLGTVHELSIVPGRSGGREEQLMLRAVVTGGRARVQVGGEVDIATAADLGAFISSVTVDGVTEVMVDLTDVAFLDSSGIRTLLLASREAAAADVVFTLLCPQSNAAVSRVLDILHMSTVLTVVSTDLRVEL